MDTVNENEIEFIRIVFKKVSYLWEVLPAESQAICTFLPQLI